MSAHSPTLLIVYLRPDRDGGVRYHVDEILAMAGIPYRLLAEQEEHVSLESGSPFVVKHNEKRIVFALRVPLIPQIIDDLAQLVTTGLIFGFVVKGEIALSSDVGVINNLG